MGFFSPLSLKKILAMAKESSKKGLATEYKSKTIERSREEHNMILLIIRLWFYIWVQYRFQSLSHWACLLSAIYFTISYLVYHSITSVQPLFPGYSCTRLGHLLHMHCRFLLIMYFPELNSSQQGKKDSTVYLPSGFHLINLNCGQNLMCKNPLPYIVLHD